MADLQLPSTVGVAELSIAPWSPGQEDVIAPYVPRTLAAGPVTTGWTGTVRLAPHRQVDQQAADRSMLALRGRMRGNRHRLRLPLTSAYRGAPPPDDMTATVLSARRTGETLELRVSYVNRGVWTPTPGSFCNVGERLYLIDTVGFGAALGLVPTAVPLAIRRPRGIWPTTGGAGPSNFTEDALGTFRGSVYEGGLSPGEGRIFWLDLSTGTRREVISGAGPVRSLARAFGNLYANETGSGTSSRISRVDLDLSDPIRNKLVPVWTFSDLSPRPPDRLSGMAEWQGPDDSGPKLYVGRGTTLYRSRTPVPPTLTATTFAAAFEQITGPTGFTSIDGLSPGPNPGDPLYILDAGANKIWTWDGTVQAEWADGTVGATAGPNVVSLNNCRALEWINGSLYVLHSTVGTRGYGVARVNVDTPSTAQSVEFAEPFVMARLSGGATTGPAGHHFPVTSFDWTEAVE